MRILSSQVETLLSFLQKQKRILKLDITSYAGKSGHIHIRPELRPICKDIQSHLAKMRESNTI